MVTSTECAQDQLNAGRQWPLLTADNGFNLAFRRNPRVNVDNEQVPCGEKGRAYQQNAKEKKEAHDANAMRYPIWQASLFAIITFLRRKRSSVALLQSEKLPLNLKPV